MLTHFKYAEWETVALNTDAIVRVHSLEPTDQKRIISQIVKAIRDRHSKGSAHEGEASRILTKITTANLKGTFAEFYRAILSNLMSYGVLYRSSLEAGIFTTAGRPMTQNKEYGHRENGKPHQGQQGINSAGKDGTCNAC